MKVLHFFKDEIRIIDISDHVNYSKLCVDGVSEVQEIVGLIDQKLLTQPYAGSPPVVVFKGSKGTLIVKKYLKETAKLIPQKLKYLF